METFTTGDISRLCSVHPRTVRRWIDREYLRGHRNPGHGDYRVYKHDLVAFLKENKFPVPPELSDSAGTVLVVDDDPLMAKSIARILKRAGFKVLIAKDGFQGGVMLETARPDFLTLDLRMPGLSGFDVLSFIKKEVDLPHLKIIVISGLPEKELIRAKQLGADVVLGKPFSEKELAEIIRGLSRDAAITSPAQQRHLNE